MNTGIHVLAFLALAGLSLYFFNSSDSALDLPQISGIVFVLAAFLWLPYTIWSAIEDFQDWKGKQ